MSVPSGRRRRRRNATRDETVEGAADAGEARTGAWTSALSAGELVAIGSVGFEPVGQVMGSVVLRLGRTGRYWGYHDCRRPSTSLKTPPRSMPAAPVRARVAVSGEGAASATVVEVFDRARQLVLRRMSAQCSAVGGHGVVAAAVTMAAMDAQPGCLEFKVVGTAVRARESRLHLKAPFTSHLDGHGFAKLLATGWVPVELLVGMSIGVRHDDSYSHVRKFSRNTEVSGLSDLVRAVRSDARRQLQLHGARRGGNALILASGGTLRVWQETCMRSAGNEDELAFRDHLAESTLTGSTIAQFRALPRGKTLPVVPLGDGGRAAYGRPVPAAGSYGGGVGAQRVSGRQQPRGDRLGPV